MSSPAASRAPRRGIRPQPDRQPLVLAKAAQASRVPFVLLTAGVVVAGVLALAALTVTVNQQAFAVARLEQSTRAGAARYSELQAEVGVLRSPARISRVAHQRGLRPVLRARIVRWPSSPEGEVPTTPAAATSPAAVGVRTDPLEGQAWTPADPLPLKHYLAQP